MPAAHTRTLPPSKSGVSKRSKSPTQFRTPYFDCVMNLTRELATSAEKELLANCCQPPTGCDVRYILGSMTQIQMPPQASMWVVESANTLERPKFDRVHGVFSL